MSSIVPIGSHVNHPLEPVEEVVKLARGILRRAESGELRALAYAGVSSDKGVLEGWERANGTKFSLSAAISILDYRYAKDLDESGFDSDDMKE